MEALGAQVVLHAADVDDGLLDVATLERHPIVHRRLEYVEPCPMRDVHARLNGPVITVVDSLLECGRQALVPEVGLQEAGHPVPYVGREEHGVVDQPVVLLRLLRRLWAHPLLDCLAERHQQPALGPEGESP